MTDEKDDPAEARREKYMHLPSPVRIEDTITSQERNRAAIRRAGETPTATSRSATPEASSR
jgi:hypothetical protein